MYLQVMGGAARVADSRSAEDEIAGDHQHEILTAGIGARNHRGQQAELLPVNSRDY